MKYLITLMTLVIILFAAPVQASDRIPFGHQIVPVQNYSRATELTGWRVFTVRLAAMREVTPSAHSSFAITG